MVDVFAMHKVYGIFQVGRFQTTSLWIRHLEVCLNEHWLPTQEWVVFITK